MSAAELIFVCLFTLASIVMGVLTLERNRYAGCAILSFPASLWLAIIIRVAMAQ